MAFIKNNRLLKMILSALAGWPLYWVRASWQVVSTEIPDEVEAMHQAKIPVIYALWHGRMYSLLKSVPLDSVAILVSPSNDGEFITRISRRVGFRHFVRGSHKRGGAQAILALKRALQAEQRSIAFTVDGPRGPRYKVKPGIIRLASQTGAPIIPLGSASLHLLKKFDASWDHYHAPLPFTQMRIIYGEPIRVPSQLSEDELAEYCSQLEAELLRINLAMDQQFGFYHEKRL